MYIVNEIDKLNKIPVKPIGTIALKNSKEIKCSPISVGMEKADGGFYDPHKVIPFIGGTGVKWVRLQSGWGKTEIEEGVYDFKWLDDIVDEILEQGAMPWMCLCYASYIYDDKVEKGGRGIGRAPIFTERQRQGWANYVKAVVNRYKGKITHYEIWNEPDGEHCWKTGVNGVEYGKFAYTTAKLIKETDKNAKVIVGSMCNLIRLKRYVKDCGITFDDDKNMANFFTDFLEQGCAKYSDFISFHTYNHLPEYKAKELVDEIKNTARKYNPNIEVMQGETGVHADFSKVGALNSADWTEELQAKYLLRRMYTDIFNGCYMSSYFSMADMYESMSDGCVGLNKSMFGTYGVIAACFDKDGIFTGEYSPRPSYLALKVTSNVFAGGVKKAKDFVEFCAHRNSYWGSTDIDENDDMGKMLTMYTFERNNGSKFVAYYVASSLLNVVYNGTTTLKVNKKLKKPLLVNAKNGEIYAIPPSNIKREKDGLLIMRAPIYDYPMLLIDGEDTDLL